MPAYGSAPPENASPGYKKTVWDNEVVAPGSASVAVALPREASFPSCISIELEFASNPGAFQIDLQTADTNQEKYYVTKASLTTGLNTSFVGRVEVTNLVAKFCRLSKVSMANNVAVSARIF